MSVMIEEIRCQPDVISGLADAEYQNATAIAAEIKERRVQFVTIAARGTSDHAAIFGKYLLEIRNELPVALADPSIFTLYDAKLKLDRTLAIGISQSGQAPDVAEYLRRSRELGALTLAITNEAGSTLTEIAEHTILCRAGKEIGVAATKTYTSTLAVLYMLSSALAGDACCDQLKVCADAMRETLSLESEIKAKAERYRYMEAGAVIGRGYNFCTALETALKLAETSYIGMRGFSAADFLHGPVATVHEGYPCILIAAPGRAYQMMIDLAARLNDLRAETLLIGSDESISEATTVIRISAQIDEDLSPLVHIVPGQLLAHYLALARGYDPDRPRGLSKVTLTR